MTLALATRGYLCAGRRPTPQTYGPGPSILGIDVVKPGIDAAAVTAPPAPSITGAGVKGPQISGAASTPPPAGTGVSPVIVGAGVISPGIDKSKSRKR